MIFQGVKIKDLSLGRLKKNTLDYVIYSLVIT